MYIVNIRRKHFQKQTTSEVLSFISRYTQIKHIHTFFIINAGKVQFMFEHFTFTRLKGLHTLMKMNSDK